MKIMNTSAERVDALIDLSSAAYEAIDTVHEHEPEYRTLLLHALPGVALALNDCPKDDVGTSYRRTLQDSLKACGFENHGLRYGTWGSPIDTEPLRPHAGSPLHNLACLYADVERITLDRKGALETNARHVIHLGILATAYAAKEYTDLDENLIALYTLVHDIPEAYAGDVISLGASTETMRKKQIAEQAALARIAKEFQDIYPEFITLIYEYEHLGTPEAKFVKSFDKLDPGFPNLYTGGTQLIKHYGFSNKEAFLASVDESNVRMEKYAASFQKVVNDKAELTRRIAQVTFAGTRLNS